MPQLQIDGVTVAVLDDMSARALLNLAQRSMEPGEPCESINVENVSRDTLIPVPAHPETEITCNRQMSRFHVNINLEYKVVTDPRLVKA
jgi:hypothetical protein